MELEGLWYKCLELMHEIWHLLEITSFTPHVEDHSALLLPAWLHLSVFVLPVSPTSKGQGSVLSTHSGLLNDLDLQT